MPTAYTLAAARTALQTLTSLRSVTGKTKEVRDLNAAIDAAIREAEKVLEGDTAIPFAVKKEAILAVLRPHARAGLTIIYTELGQQVGNPTMGPWQPVLDAIGADERAAGRPDIAVLVVNKGTGVPGWAKTPEQKAQARAERDKVFQHHRPRSTDGRAE